MTPPEHHVVGINPIYKSGSISRWHANPDVPAQSLADHQCRVAQIILFFWPKATRDMLYAALHHDCGELITGDVPSPTKDANPALRAALSQAEADARLSMGITSFVADFPMLRFADRLEAYTYVALHCHHLLGQPEWVRAIAELGEMADALGVSKRLTEWFAK
jgi:hypothetical protein